MGSYDLHCCAPPHPAIICPALLPRARPAACSFINNLGGSIAFFAGLVLWTTSAEWCRRCFFEVCTLLGWLQPNPCTLLTVFDTHLILFLSLPQI